MAPDDVQVQTPASAPGLAQALAEMGPNELTELADELQIDGFERPSGGFFPMWQTIGAFRDDLVQFLSGKRQAFIGGVAVRSYGAREGPTFDYDILIASEHLQEVHSFLEKSGATLKGTIEDTYLYRVTSLAFDVDVRVARSDLDRAALAGAKTATYRGVRLGIVAPVHLACMKVKAFSERAETDKGRMDRLDVLGLLRTGATTAEAVRGGLLAHRPDLIATFDRMIQTAS